ncbi:hypothetical protein K7X08_026370 [Anisodus acutangulus]|uniref:Uncharacterized protein n=1 Tax=Anisodus acutangulus TaxID=402998 RepID=A0A9Q1R4V4_9SOLA|nr:hypothetical protein K7X08_026370 [Anisodus acutangulus]
MPRPYVEEMRATRSGNCRSTNEVIGRQAIVATGTRTHAFFCPNTRYTVALKLTIMNVMERNSVSSPRIRFLAAFEIAKMMKPMFPLKMGNPLCSLLPPGTVIAAANAMVAMSAAAIVHEFDVSFIQISPSAFNFSCSSLNTTCGALSSWFKNSQYEGGTNFFTS